MKIFGYRAVDLASVMLLAFGVVAATVLFLKYIALIFLPFLLGWGVAFSVRPASCAISRRTHVPVRVVREALTLLMLAALGAAVWFCAGALWREGGRLVNFLSENPHIFDGMFDAVDRPVTGGRLGEYISDILSRAVESVVSYIAAAAGKIISSLPGIFFFVVISVISAIYFSLDLDAINKSVLSLLSEKCANRLKIIRCGIFKNIFLYIRSYFFLAVITFVILTVGFVILGVEYALLLAFIFAAVDALPILGVGAALVPWAIYEIATGHSGLGFGLLILFAVAVTVRETLEPKILGTHLGVHPVITLIFLYGGYRLGGITGVIISPFLALVFRIFVDKYREYKGVGAEGTDGNGDTTEKRKTSAP